MPLYTYACTACGGRFESLQGMSEPAPACPSCGGSVRRAWGAFAVHGEAARGREAAMRSLEPRGGGHCGCGGHHRQG